MSLRNPFGGGPDLPQATVNELVALLREQSLLLRELVRVVGGNPAPIARVQGPIQPRTPLKADAVVRTGRMHQIQRERLREESNVAPWRVGPSTDPTSPNAGAEPDSPTPLFAEPTIQTDPSQIG
jgi:hypothetical protein